MRKENQNAVRGTPSRAQSGKRNGWRLLMLLLLLLAFAYVLVSCFSSNRPGQPETPAETSASTEAQNISVSEQQPAEDAPGLEDPAADSDPEIPTELSDPLREENSTFEIVFLDVGEADAALVLCDGYAMMIDGGNSDDSDLVYTFLKDREIRHLDYIVCSHPHEDHVGGLSGALNYADAGTAYCPVTEYDSRAFRSFVRYLGDTPITIPDAGDSFHLGSAEVRILGPISKADSVNNNSIVLRIVYGNTSFLFTGDAKFEEEGTLLDSGCELASTVLKVGHHGAYYSTGYRFLREVSPAFAVISCGENEYGHPTEGTLSRLRDAGTTVYRTDLQGSILCRSDGDTVTFFVERNPDADTFQPGLAPERTMPEDSAEETDEPDPDREPESGMTEFVLIDPDSETETGERTIPNEQSADGNAQTGGNPGSGEEQKSEETAPEVAEEIAQTRSAPADSTSTARAYVLNTNTHKFHYPDCSDVSRIKDKNRQDYTGTREEIIGMGYSPCGHCHP